MGGGGGLKFSLPHAHIPMVRKLFLIMFVCIFKFDGQIETVHVSNVTSLVFDNSPCITLHMTCIFNLRQKGLISEKNYLIYERKFEK